MSDRFKGRSSISKEETGDNESRSLVGGVIGIYKFSPAILVLHVAGAIVAWLAPEDALVRWPFLDVIVASVGKVFPLLFGAIERSKFPDVTALYFALMLAAFPFRILVGFRLLYAGQAKGRETYERLSITGKVKVICGAPFFLLCGVFVLVEGYYYEFNFIPISESRLWLGLVGPLFAGGAHIMCISLGLSWIWFFVVGIFSSKEA
ncbi:hypothetical protein LGM42_28050 [Burkholderia sp. AU39826]|uniref:hypothetical protein n=1 Tax=Burkholderia sp. AU39826 TaxID=2879634 RepID=UPI001CF44F35|nr:hypothetical protein [Burkholderia sp. AU39826]MCA7973726.1 hypothetical protein [Burkholderia sp. AU39826]